MNILLLISFFILGTIIGSFLNVVLFRFNTGKGLWGRSACFSCKRHLSPIDLVPVFSFLAFRGRCRTCKSRISWQYPAVELLTGLLFAGLFYMFGPAALLYPAQFAVQMLYGMAIMSVLVLIVVYDLRHKIIPDMFSFLFGLLALAGLFFAFDGAGQFSFVMPGVWDLASGLILAFPFYLLWLVSSGNWMGLGDAKLAIGIGWFLGLSGGGSAIIFGFWIGAAISLGIISLGALFERFNSLHLLGRFRFPRLSMKSEIPFAPFLVAGLLIVFFFGYNIFSLTHTLI